jgi:hypothetical protein
MRENSAKSSPSWRTTTDSVGSTNDSATCFFALSFTSLESLSFALDDDDDDDATTLSLVSFVSFSSLGCFARSKSSSTVSGTLGTVALVEADDDGLDVVAGLGSS